MRIEPWHIQNSVTFRAWGIFNSLANIDDNHAYSEPWCSQNNLFKHFQGYLGIFRNIDAFPKFSRFWPLFLVFLKKCLSKCPSPTSPSPLPWKNFWLCTCTQLFFLFCKALYLKSLTVFRICICLDNCSVNCIVTYVLHYAHSEFWHA